MNRYFDFLCDIVWNGDSAIPLLEYLHNREFHSIISLDKNREVDGTKLREAFIDEVGHIGSSSLPGKACTVLEMLIGLAYRMEFQLYGRPDSLSVHEIFWIFIDNLDMYAQNSWENNIDMFIDRKYDKNGNGGLFPLKNTFKDQRKVEIWYQMMEYLCENWEF